MFPSILQPQGPLSSLAVLSSYEDFLALVDLAWLSDGHIPVTAADKKQSPRPPWQVPSYVMRECTAFHSSTGLCWQPLRAASPHQLATPTSPVTSNSTRTFPTTSSDGRAHAPQAALSNFEGDRPPLDNLLAAATTAPATDILNSATLARLVRQVTIGVKVVTRLRNHIPFILHSIHRRYPGMRIVIADDEYVGVAKEEWHRLMEPINDLNVSYVQLVPGVGLSAGRNALVEACETTYLVVLDDDVFFTAATKLEVLLDALESSPDATVAAGSYTQYDSTRAVSEVNAYDLLFSSEAPGVWKAQRPTAWPAGMCKRVHATHNFLMARRDTLLRYPWHPKLSIFEHEHFFFQLYLANQVVLSCPHVAVFHYRAANLHDNRYVANSLRFKEHLFARHFCNAFPAVKRFDAPFWLYDCANGKLCPRWDKALSCVEMEDPLAFTRQAIPLKAIHPVKRVLDVHTDPPLPSSPQHVLVLGEGGGGTDILSELLMRAGGEHLVWEEPCSWRFHGHMPDELLGALLSALFRCDLSAQQLQMMHTHAPLRAGSTQRVAVGEEDLFAARYSSKGLHPSSPRFCGFGVATAAISTRFHHGLPAALSGLPLRILLAVRNPVDVVVARLRAKRVRGGPAWPECQHSTIAACAGALCDSMMLMLRTLRADTHNLHLIRWETFTKRKQKMAAKILSLLGVTNRSGLAEAMLGVEKMMGTAKALTEKHPISPRSRYIVERRCAAVMDRLGYRFYTTALPSGSSGYEKRYVQLASPVRGSHNVSALHISGKIRTPALLLAHVHSSPSFYMCPVRLAGAEIVTRFFIRRDCPKATASPLCFPESAEDHCPMRHAAKWHRSPWGDYPFRVHSAITTPNATMVAFVRNPWDRLVSAFLRFITVDTKSTAVHRAWIREMHGMGDQDVIHFTHFVRWVAQQDSAAMHLAWQPYTATCDFNRVRYSMIIRLESFDADFKKLLRLLRLGEEDERLAEYVMSKTRPTDPIGSVTRVQRLHHFYLTDDEYDLVEVVRGRYYEDIQRFGYTFLALVATRNGTQPGLPSRDS